ncbi:uncharacterized protein TA03705 [Theileria annulata]|uniref:Spp2/MOS2 G-patch domain-containing protein n=1 Tax=Theileria annulata TaxID=5874 RepID=Q4UCY1_THEAN|nr:uncharacterized protein TA03705 [Theileria annulata]CAI75320.1 hypothetical protein TA03705 [Theileria annulata]|eukprot:XP_954796.1 hypothetical protein TA03705 [Theileria annulata]
MKFTISNIHTSNTHTSNTLNTKSNTLNTTGPSATLNTTGPSGTLNTTGLSGTNTIGIVNSIGIDIFEKEEVKKLNKEIIKEFRQDIKLINENNIIPCKNKLIKPNYQFNINKQLNYGLNFINTNEQEKKREEEKEVLEKGGEVEGLEEKEVLEVEKVEKELLEEEERLYEKLFNIKKNNIKLIKKNKELEKNNLDKNLENKNNLESINNVENIKKILKLDKRQYEKVPVENFGIQMLMGMGYNPKINKENNKKYIKRIYEKGGLGTDIIMENNMKLTKITKNN